MKQLVMCKTCGFIIDEEKLRNICPACGAGRNEFRNYTENISARRKRILDLNIHPMILNFPQAISVLIPVCIIIASNFPATIRGDFMSTARVLAFLFPAAVLAAFCAGLFDARVRFGKLSTPYIKRKIILGIILYILSAVIALLVFQYGYSSKTQPVILILSGLSIACEVLLASIGKKLRNAVIGG